MQKGLEKDERPVAAHFSNWDSNGSTIVLPSADMRLRLRSSETAASMWDEIHRVEK